MDRSLLALVLLAFGLFISPITNATTEKVLYHIHNTNPNSFQRTVSNLENLKKGMPGREIRIKILLQGKSLHLLNPALHAASLNKRFMQLLDAGAEIETSRSNWRHYTQKTQLISTPILVPNIFDRIIELQKQGYRYITP